jgi:HlyD family secretion protein
LDIKDPPLELKQDMTVSVDIETARKDNTLLIPISAVHDYDSKAPWVYLIQQGIAQKQTVNLGLDSHGLVQVLSGLKAGDMVTPIKYTHIRDGSRVRLTP